MTRLRRLAVVLAALAIAPLAAHVLEMPNKLMLSGPLWLAVQQHLYRGWGPFYGAPVEIGALCVSGVLAWREWGGRSPTVLAALCYAGMIAVFFIFNAPVNHALNGWTARTLPADWSRWRLQWEIGHALAAVLAVIALLLLLRGGHKERVYRTRTVCE